MKIALDIGHANGSDARGIFGERQISQQLAPMLAARLREAGHEVQVLDFPTLTNRADLSATIAAINAGNFDLSVSLHCDDADSPAARGAHVIYYSLKGYTAAIEVADRLCLLMPGRAEKTVRRRLDVLRKTNCTAILIELGFTDNSVDAAKLTDPRYLARVADAISEGLEVYCDNMPPG